MNHGGLEAELLLLARQVPTRLVHDGFEVVKPSITFAVVVKDWIIAVAKPAAKFVLNLTNRIEP